MATEKESSMRYNYFDFLLDKTGEVLKNYIDNPIKEPPPWQICKQYIEKSLAVKASSPQLQTIPEFEGFQDQKIWQPLCLSMTLIAHMKWDLDKLQEKLPLHLQQVVMEELLKGYDIPSTPQPEMFDMSKLSKREAMAHIIYNRWVVRTITKYEELKERDILPINLSSVAREARENQEHSIFKQLKLKEHLSVDILEKALYHEDDLLIPLPKARTIHKIDSQPIEPPPFQPQDQVPAATDQPHDSGASSTDQDGSEPVTTPPKGLIMKVSPLLDVDIVVPLSDVISQICLDLGSYYFPKEMFGDAGRVFQRAYDVQEKAGLKNELISSFHLACCHLTKQPVPDALKPSDLYSRLDQSEQNQYQGVIEILKEDNLKQELSISRRLAVEKDVFLLDKRTLLFEVCTCNFLRCCLDGCYSNAFAFYQSLHSADNKETDTFLQLCEEFYLATQNTQSKENIKNGFKICMEEFSEENKERLKESQFFNSLFSNNEKLLEPKIKKEKMETSFNQQLDYEMEDSTGGHFSRDIDNDERVSKLCKLKAQLITCFEPETLKDILFELHEIPPEQSHAVAFEMKYYKEIFNEIHDSLMRDTVHIFIAKSKQLTSQKQFTRALNILNTCLKILTSYATRASPGCSTSRVKNIMHHELLWTELKFAEEDPDKANTSETMRRSKACIQHSNQNPPPQPHVYLSIVAYLLNNRENQFLVDTCANFDLNIIEFQQIGYYISKAVCASQHGIDALRNPATELWETVMKIIGESVETEETAQQPPPPQPIMGARGPNEEKEMWSKQCFVRREDFLQLLVSLTDDSTLSLMLSCIASLLDMTQPDSGVVFKDTYTRLWPTNNDNHVRLERDDVLSVLHPLCQYCIQRNGRNITWLRTIADVYLLAGDYCEAMKCYLELGSITSSFFSRPVDGKVWDDKIYRSMIKCCKKEKAFSQAMVLSQFVEPVDYDNAFDAIRQRTTDDATDCFYDCLWDVNILEYLIYTHEKRGEIDKRKLAVQIIGQPELNTKCNTETLQQAQCIRKTRFLRSLTRDYWR